jgi:DNA-binding CsgD family transcriptional regulator
MPEVAVQSITSVLSALGVDRAQERLYFRLRPVSGHTLEGVASMLQTGVDRLLSDAAPLRELGLVLVEEGRLQVPPLHEAVAALVSQEAVIAEVAARRLGDLAEAVPHLVAASTRPSPEDVGEVLPLDGELSSGGNPLQLLTEMIESSRGDMLWLRPDAWRMPRESAVAQVLAEAMASGRRSRAIYPARALQEAPEALLTRARAGEQIRVISDLSTRMFILGDAHAVMPEPLGFADEPRVHVRQRSIVAALTMWFEALWDAATPVPQLDLGEPRPDLRKFLLEQLAQGATDEQIAPKLGISLRTVRRRVSSIMIELGADTRFQAGVEAVRRGWI